METQSFIVVTYDDVAELYRTQVFMNVVERLPVFLRANFSDEKVHFIHSLLHKPNGEYDCYFTFNIDPLGRIIIH